MRGVWLLRILLIIVALIVVSSCLAGGGQRPPTLGKPVLPGAGSPTPYETGGKPTIPTPRVPTPTQQPLSWIPPDPTQLPCDPSQSVKIENAQGTPSHIQVEVVNTCNHSLWASFEVVLYDQEHRILELHSAPQTSLFLSSKPPTSYNETLGVLLAPGLRYDFTIFLMYLTSSDQIKAFSVRALVRGYP
ncbi:MAG: hypothetical protein HW403_535 [Dehalococcoidia bacterium]|nr:hypothetical protein [Dehalococcoidia bacterium]